LWKATSSGGLTQVPVATTDKGFYLGTWYYVYLVAREEALVTVEL
jgi:hypothetical protein